MTTTDEPLPHGYTLAGLERAAREAAWGCRWAWLPRAEQIDVARFAIVEYLYTCEQPGDFWAVVRVGRYAIHAAYVVKEMHHAGVTPKHSGLPGAVPLPRYWTYWRSTSVPTRSAEEPVVESLAVRQILATLAPPYRRVLLALAEHDDYHAAAAATGKAYHGFETTLSMARKQFLYLWHEGETPSRVWGRDRRSTRRRLHRDDYKAITVVTIRRRRQRRAKSQPANSCADDAPSPAEPPGLPGDPRHISTRTAEAHAPQPTTTGDPRSGRGGLPGDVRQRSHGGDRRPIAAERVRLASGGVRGGIRRAAPPGPGSRGGDGRRRDRATGHQPKQHTVTADQAGGPPYGWRRRSRLYGRD